MRSFYPWVYRLVSGRVRDCEAARELVDDVLVVVVQALREGKLRSPDRIDSFVYGVALNLSNNRLRSAARQPHLEPLAEELASVDPVTSYEWAERVEICRRALKHLEPLDQQILYLTLVGGMRSGEIAAELGLSSSLVRQRKSRAQKKIAQYLDPGSGRRVPGKQSRT